MVLLTENEANKLLAPFVSPVQEVRRIDNFYIPDASFWQVVVPDLSSLSFGRF